MIRRIEEPSSIENSMRAKPAVGHSRLRPAINFSRSASSLRVFQFNRPALPKRKKQKGEIVGKQVLVGRKDELQLRLASRSELTKYPYCKSRD